MNTVHFLLVPDRTAARCLRRLVCENGGGLGVQVGTWPELLQAALDAWLLAPSQSDWFGKIAEALQTREGFWSRSCQVAPEETTAAIAQELNRLLRSRPPGKGLAVPDEVALSERARRHLSDLAALAPTVGLPNELADIKALLEASAEQRIRSIIVYQIPEFPRLDPWQRALIDRLNAENTTAPLQHWQTLLETHLPLSSRGTGGALRFLQDQLFSDTRARTERDGSLQWLGVRDYLEEIEVAAGMIQLAVKTEGRRFADFAVLLPDDTLYDHALEQVFTRAGIPLSGLDRRQVKRDTAAEAIFEFLLTLNKPAPVMAMASLVSSPLMPWDSRTGFDLADQIMSGRFAMDRVELESEAARAMRTLLTGRVETRRELRQALTRFAELLAAPAGKEETLEKARERLQALRQQIQGEGPVDWPTLLAATAPTTIQMETAGELIREGVAVFHENLEPWRSINTLFVLGFSAGHYPATAPVSPVLAEEDVSLLKQAGWELESATERGQRLRGIFARQLKAARNRIHFLVPRRNAAGDPLAPSASLAFMAALFSGVDAPEEMILDLDAEQERNQVQGLPQTAPIEPEPPRALSRHHLNLERNLLCILTRPDGTPYPLSPSSIETLMTSPLAWVLSRAGLEAREFSPDELDVMTKGTLAHAVFEQLFAPGKEPPEAEAIRARVPDLLVQAIRSTAPFLQRPEWRVERNHLQKEIEEAALSWRQMLATINARPLGVEVWLTGHLDGHPIHGSADCLLQLPGGRILVVDYKKSKSKMRRVRMQAGYDSQASLYRTMLQTGGGVFISSDGTKVNIDPDAEIGVLYYLMNDQTALADTENWLDPVPPGLEELGQDVSIEAMKLIRQRLTEAAQGKVPLNTTDDAVWFEKNAGITLYAIKDNPLVRLFLLQDEEEQS